MNNLKKYIGIGLVILCSGSTLYAQNGHTENSGNKNAITYKEFLSRMISNNLSYTAERFNIDIAEAEVQAAKAFPDPELSFGWADNQQKRMQMGYGFEAELSWDLELGGKRKARKNLARDQKVLAELELQEFFHTLRAESTVTFLEGMQNKMLFDIQRDSYLSMQQVAQSDSIRYSLGQISKVDAIQSKLEAKSMWNDLQDADDTWENSLVEIRNIISVNRHDTIYVPEGSFDKFARLFDLDDLIVTAQNNRADYLVARQNKVVAGRQVALARAERAIDLGLSVGVENNSFVKNAVAPTPGNTVVKAGISVPLKFSNRKESGLKTALYEEKQADLEYLSIELELEKEITQAYRNYLTKQKQIYRFENGMLQEAKEVFEGIKYSYQRGASSLLEVLDAQRTYNEIQQAYAETLFEYASALVELEKAVGIWDIDF
ncbi:MULTISPECIES: TolC family protein [Myroides]|uniref:TolC family protein n=1 Tax=Myroides albus TaxID=2562892 RepID=A0A6I3LFE8_9FLAO|nr:MULTISPECIES: TolC family protein [Myroides]MTG96627.1 TolC family protein [Myroides albus]MVX35258.1 TolC family protein [Myroides sp. LoEW2-1]UVD80960.1 TolC family protein [Myroides albus]